MSEIFGRYNLNEALFEEGAAVVYKALDTDEDRDVLVKIVQTHNFSLDNMQLVRQRFSQEMSSIARLSHPHIRQILDHGEQRGKPYLVMPWLEGVTLQQKIKDRKQVPWYEALPNLIPIADALAYAHSQGVYHKDITPSNIFVSHSNWSMLQNFHSAEILGNESTLDPSFRFLGSAAYMAPELETTRTVDAHSEVYSLGIVLFEMLTGKPPFEASTDIEMHNKHASEAVPSISELVKDIPKAVEITLLKALEKDPVKRYTTMEEFCEVLKQIPLTIPQSMEESQPVITTPEESRREVAEASIALQTASEAQNSSIVQNIAQPGSEKVGADELKTVSTKQPSIINPESSVEKQAIPPAIPPAIPLAVETGSPVQNQPKPTVVVPPPPKIVQPSSYVPYIPPANRVVPKPVRKKKRSPFVWIGLELAAMAVLVIIIVVTGNKSDRVIPTAEPTTGAAVVVPPTENARPAEKPLSDAPVVLNVLSFTNEIQTMAIAFEKLHPNVDVVYTYIPMTNGEYQNKLMTSVLAGDVPDVVALEISFVKEYVEDDFLADLTDLKPYADELRTYPYVLDVGTDKGVLKAYSYQATPGAFFYRRSLAIKYFGTDDPAYIQSLVDDMDKFTAAAEIVKDYSGGNTCMIPSIAEFQNLFYANRSLPWIVNNTLTIDPIIDEMIAISKIFRDNNFECGVAQWTDEWFNGMSDTLTDSYGNPKQIFGYFLPTWGLSYLLSPFSTSSGSSTVGDWAMVTGPLPYQWGGTWLGVMKDSLNIDWAKEFVRFATLDEENLTNWATGVYTNAYLKSIDPTVPDDQQQAAGDFVSSQVVVEKIIPEFDNTNLSMFLGGQNSYRAFNEAAPYVSARLMQSTDDAIQRAFNDALSNYLNGVYTLDEMWMYWKESILIEMPNLNMP